jgi:NTE family protein
MNRVGLVLTGGGARAAYQAGALKAIAEICAIERNPFKVISGVSAGAFNGLWLASEKTDFRTSTQSMWESWAAIEMHNVFKTDSRTLLNIGAHWLKDLSLGGLIKHSNINYLLDATPLASFLKSKIDFKMIQHNVSSKKIHGIAVTATHYYNGTSVTYFDGHPSISSWSREGRESRRATLHLKHALASSAIPFFFQPIELEDGFYGDGGIHLSSPLSPAIHMGADRILAIGINHKHCAKELPGHPISKTISPGDIAGTLLNALFFHSIDADIERLNRINRTLSILTEEQLATEPDKLRQIPVLVIRPSQDLGQMASELYQRFPEAIKYFLRGLGASALESWDLMSYLAFEKEYVQSILKLGYKDALAQKKNILQFFEDPGVPTKESR